MDLAIVSTHNDWKYVFDRLKDRYVVFHYEGKFFFHVQPDHDVVQELKHVLAGLYYAVDVKKPGVW